MASPTMQSREPHRENERSIPRESSNMRPESTTSAGFARSSPRGSKHSHTADGVVRSVEAAKAMEDLEVETGFASYAAYFESLGYNPAYQGPSWDDFKQSMRSRQKVKSVCAIIDLFTKEALPPKASLRGENLSADQALQSLRTPPKGVAVQIVFWSLDEVWRILHPDFVTVFGLGLKLEPRFFRSLATDPRCDIVDGIAVNEESLSEYFCVAGTIVTIARNCPLARPGATPILLIAALARLDYHNHIDTSALYYQTQEAPSIRNPGVSQPNVGDPKQYAWLLTIAMNQNPDCTDRCEALLFGSLLPLLQLDILRMRARCSHVRSKIQPAKSRAVDLIKYELKGASSTHIEAILNSTVVDTADARLYQYRISLRSCIEGFEGLSQPLSRFISSQLTPELTTSPAYNRNAGERVLLLKEAHSLEAEIRDFLQLQAGQLSLLESRKSIEVSNTQLQESKRGNFIAGVARYQRCLATNTEYSNGLSYINVSPMLKFKLHVKAKAQLLIAFSLKTVSSYTVTAHYRVVTQCYAVATSFILGIPNSALQISPTVDYLLNSKLNLRSTLRSISNDSPQHYFQNSMRSKGAISAIYPKVFGITAAIDMKAAD